MTKYFSHLLLLLAFSVCCYGFSSLPLAAQDATSPTSSSLPAPRQVSTPSQPVQPRSVSSIQESPSPGPTNPLNVPTPPEFSNFDRPSLITQGFVLVLFSLLPFVIMILTSFLKIVVVLSLLRSALGVQQAPPNQIINGVAFMLSIFVMYPTILQMYDVAQQANGDQPPPSSFTSTESTTYILNIASSAREPLREFLKRNSSVKHQSLFYRMAYRVLPIDHRPDLKPDDFIILVPSYITSQLKDAFEIGVLIYIPFFVIDLVTSNILLAMGMMMLSPVTISMPLKLFLLVMLDGWTLLIEGLVTTFR
jgi:type III secretion protein R